jgi:hypothetical protein
MRVRPLLITAAFIFGAGLVACRPIAPPPSPAPPSLPTLPAFTPPKWMSGSLDGIIQARPVFVPGTPDVVVVATENDSLYGFEASTGDPLWGPVSIGTAEPLSEVQALDPTNLDGCGNLDPLGITSNPVFDPVSGDVYAVGERESTTLVGLNHVPEHVIVGINPVTGHVDLTPTPIDPPAMTVAGVNEVEAQQQRAGLAAANGKVYVGFGGDSNDCGPYHGFVVGVNESDGSIAGSFEAANLSGDRQAAVWAPGGLAIDAAGNVYAATGNSPAQTEPPVDYSIAVVKLPSTLGATPTDYFQPSTWAGDNAGDLDLGTSSPLLVSAGSQVFQIGKRGSGYLLSTSSLGTPVSELDGVCASFGSTATLGASVFVPCQGSSMKQVAINGSGSSATLSAGWRSPSNVHASGPAVADPVSNLVWSVDTASSVLYGINPANGDAAVRGQLSLNGAEHFPTPTVGGGLVFVESNNQVEAFPT